MLLQPVALAISRWSPNSWVSSLRYGVSPQPGARAAELEQRLGAAGWSSPTPDPTAPGRPRALAGTHPSATRSTSRCSSIGSQVDALALDLALVVRRAGGRRTARSRCSRRARPGRSTTCPGPRGCGTTWSSTTSAPAQRARRARTPSSGSRREGRRSRTCRNRCTGRPPRSGSRWRPCASRRGRCPWGTCRREAAR